MHWTWFALGIYGLIGISRFAWAMSRKATWDKNIWAQETIRNLSGVALLVVVIFETFLWPVELAICFYAIRKQKGRKKGNPYLNIVSNKPYKICTNTGCKFSPGIGNIHDQSCPQHGLREQCLSTLMNPEEGRIPLQCSRFKNHGGLHEAANVRWVSPT